MEKDQGEPSRGIGNHEHRKETRDNVGHTLTQRDNERMGGKEVPEYVTRDRKEMADR